MREYQFDVRTCNNVWVSIWAPDHGTAMEMARQRPDCRGFFSVAAVINPRTRKQVTRDK